MRQSKASAYDVITERILEALDRGTIPWRKPWAGGQFWPRSLQSGKPYRGINVFLLSLADFENPHWITFRQAKQLGGSVRKGERGMPVTFWKEWETEDKESGDVVTVPVLRYYTVFNVNQCDLPTEKVPPLPEQPTFEHDPIVSAATVIDGYVNGPSIVHGFTRAKYVPREDTVKMPLPERFEQRTDYYATLFHELGHSTGHADRLARKGVVEEHTFGSDPYAQEELVAEMTGAFLCGHCGIVDVTLETSAAYIDGWRRVMKQDKKLVVVAAAQAQKAADLILGHNNGEVRVGSTDRDHRSRSVVPSADSA